MNNGRMWTVVNPTIGLPLLLGGVITVSLVVHHAIMRNAPWVASFFNGGA